MKGRLLYEHRLTADQRITLCKWWLGLIKPEGIRYLPS